MVYQGFGLQEHHTIAKNHGWLTLIYHTNFKVDLGNWGPNYQINLNS